MLERRVILSSPFLIDFCFLFHIIDFVFDTNFTADLTIMEEANELLKRIEVAQTGTEEEKAKMPLPMFTSCCPGWVNLVEQSYPELIPHLSSCRSPMGMMSSLIRHYWWPKQMKVNPNEAAAVADVDQSNLYVVSVMPCTAKKDEMSREQLGLNNGRGQETNAVLTVREMARLMELRGVAQRDDLQSFNDVPELPYDNPLGESTGAAGKIVFVLLPSSWGQLNLTKRIANLSLVIAFPPPPPPAKLSLVQQVVSWKPHCELQPTS
jgi:iron only hydrogenase large subunit-like protein